MKVVTQKTKEFNHKWNEMEADYVELIFFFF